VFSYLLFQSRIAYQKGSVSWKGRRYKANRGFATSDEVLTGYSHDGSREPGAASTRTASPQGQTWST
jgi:hypothetical protein